MPQRNGQRRAAAPRGRQQQAEARRRKPRSDRKLPDEKYGFRMSLKLTTGGRQALRKLATAHGYSSDSDYVRDVLTAEHAKARRTRMLEGAAAFAF